VLAFAITAAVASTPRTRNLRAVLPSLGIIAGLPVLTLAWHALLAPLVAAPTGPAVAMWAAWTAVAGFATLLATFALISSAPQAALARALYPHAVAGFHLDALFTRLTFRVWPPTITPRAVRVAPERAYLRLERAA
jgi:hypothetical protein